MILASITELATFLLAHGDLIDDIYNALENGVNKDNLKKAIKDAKVAASDEAMKADLGLGT